MSSRQGKTSFEGKIRFEGETSFEGKIRFEGKTSFEGKNRFEGKTSFQGEISFESSQDQLRVERKTCVELWSNNPSNAEHLC